MWIKCITCSFTQAGCLLQCDQLSKPGSLWALHQSCAHICQMTVSEGVCGHAQAREEAAAKQRHAAELRAQIEAAAAQKAATAEAARREGAKAREASALHLVLVEVNPASFSVCLP